MPQVTAASNRVRSEVDPRLKLGRLLRVQEIVVDLEVAPRERAVVSVEEERLNSVSLIHVSNGEAAQHAGTLSVCTCFPS